MSKQRIHSDEDILNYIQENKKVSMEQIKDHFGYGWANTRIRIGKLVRADKLRIYRRPSKFFYLINE